MNDRESRRINLHKKNGLQKISKATGCQDFFEFLFPKTTPQLLSGGILSCTRPESGRGSISLAPNRFGRMGGPSFLTTKIAINYTTFINQKSAAVPQVSVESWQQCSILGLTYTRSEKSEEDHLRKCHHRPISFSRKCHRVSMPFEYRRLPGIY